MEIALHNVTKSFGNKRVLDKFSCRIRQQEMVAIVGQSGKGKTTLLNIMGTIEKVDLGKVSYGAICNPSGSQAAKIRRNEIGYLFQNYALVENITVEKNLKLALAYHKVDAKPRIIRDALEEVSLDTSLLKQKVYELSGGEQQRVAIARLILKPCSVILADEPTGSLDEENKKMVLTLLGELNKRGKTVVVVTHDADVAAACSSVIHL